MAIKWIVLVNRTGARIYSEKNFRRIAELKNALGREKNRAMTDAKPGMAPGGFSGRPRMHGLTGEKSPHEDAAVAFARRVAEYLRKAQIRGAFDDLLMVSEPKMLGRLKQYMVKDLLGHTEWVARDFSKLATKDLSTALHATPY